MDETRRATEVSYREAVPGDEHGLLALFENVFGRPRSQERWHWQYAASPPGAGAVSIAVAGGEVVGCAALMRQDLNHLGERIPAAQSCDAMVREDHRGAGLFTALARANHRTVVGRGVRFVIGFPNQESFPLLMRSLGRIRILVLRHYYRRTGTRRVLGSILDRASRPVVAAPNTLGLCLARLRLGGGYEVRTSTELPDDLHELLRAHQSQQVLSVWKDPEYLRWRYEHHPEHRYAFHVLRRQGAPLALAVVRERADSAVICDLIHRERRVPETAMLLRTTVHQYGRRPTCQRVVFFGRDIGFLTAAFQEAGFREEAHSVFVMSVASLSNDDPIARFVPIPDNWSISYGDTDVV